MQTLALRLDPGDDLRASVVAALLASGHEAGFVLQGIGSLNVAQLRYAGVPQPDELRGDLEILTLAGSISADGAHLHMSVSDAQGRVLGGHVCAGCIVRTTAELLLALLPGQRFTRELDPRTGYPELKIA
jgi:predicted DNA-binding protein with PD1-like motif